MSVDKFRKYYDVLELETDATLQEVEYAYRMLKRIYSSDSPAVVPGMREFSETRRMELLAEIEQAYRNLKSILKTRSQVVLPRQREMEPGVPVTGQALFRARKESGVELDEVSRRTKVRKNYLRALETEDFSKLPPAAVYIRGFVKVYSEYLGFSADDFVPDYMARYQDWVSSHKKR